jgi:Ca2+-binding EF-hand superfamily protein
MFDSKKSGKIERVKVCLILNTLGYRYDDCELDEILSLEDIEGESCVVVSALHPSCVRG